MSEDPDLTILRAPSGLSGTKHAADAQHAAPHGADRQVLKQRFVLEEALGSGGMGTVYRARDLRKVEAQDRNPFVAIKLLNADFKQHPESFMALEREASKSQGLSHTNIVSIFDFDKDGDVPFIVMELLEGQELSELLKQFPDGLPDAMAWPIIRGLLAGLRHAHDAGVVHADFKPGNVFVLPDQTIKVLDFGIARAVQLNVDDAAGEDTLFDPQRLAALTPAYASREMLNGDSAEPRDDLYSLGVVIYLILTGHHPYGRLSARDAAREQMRPDRPRRLSLRQWRALAQCLRFNRGDRPANIEQLERALFEPPFWRSKTALAAILGIAITFGLTTLRDDAEIAEVQSEARATALQDVHLQRLGALLEEAPSKAGWFEQVAVELQALRALPEARDPTEAMERRLSNTLYSAIADADLTNAVTLLREGENLVPLPGAARDLAARYARSVEDLLVAPEPTVEWLEAVDLSLERARSAFPNAARWVELEVERVEALLLVGEAALAEGDLELVGRVLALLDERAFLREPLEQLRDRWLLAQQALALEESRRLTETLRVRYLDTLTVLLNDSCVSLDPQNLASRLQSLNAQISGFSSLGRRRVDERLASCVRELAVSNPELSLKLKDDSRRAFGVAAVPTLLAVRLDPCAPAFLVGNGALSGRRGSCLDQLADGTATARLVVIPALDGGRAFAMQKHEVSNAAFARFCAATGACADTTSGTGEEPVAQVTPDLAERYAQWLSGETGYSYRLPTLEEWRRAAGSVVGANRNCLLKRGAVVRGAAAVPVTAGEPGEYGLLHAVGNVREWVLDSRTGSYVAVGGSFADPLADCTLETIAAIGNADAQTGFRLLRELDL